VLLEELIRCGDPIVALEDLFRRLPALLDLPKMPGSGLRVADARPSVELAERPRSLPHSPLDGDAHPLCRARPVTRG